MPNIIDRVSVLLTLLFLGGMQLILLDLPYYWFFFGGALGIVGTLVVVLSWQDVKLRGFQVLLLPLIYILSVSIFALFLSGTPSRQIFAVLATVGFYFLIARGVEWAFPTWNWFFTSVTFFLFSSAAYGFYFHLGMPLWAVILLIGAASFLLSLHVLFRADLTLKKQLFWGFLLTLMISEFLGVFAFLPFSYLVVGGVLFMVFYVFLHLIQKNIYSQLTGKIVAEYIILGSVGKGNTHGTRAWPFSSGSGG